MCRNMIPGLFMANRLESGQAGIRIQDCFLPALVLGLASDLESAFSAGLAGAGTTGGPIGEATMSVSTTVPSYPTVEFSLIAIASIMVADFMVETRFTAETHFMEGTDFMTQADSMVPVLVSTVVQALTPGHSAALITAETPEGFPLAGRRASMEGVVSTAAVASTAAAVTGKHRTLQQTQFTIWRMK